MDSFYKSWLSEQRKVNEAYNNVFWNTLFSLSLYLTHSVPLYVPLADSFPSLHSLPLMYMHILFLSLQDFKHTPPLSKLFSNFSIETALARQFQLELRVSFMCTCILLMIAHDCAWLYIGLWAVFMSVLAWLLCVHVVQGYEEVPSIAEMPEEENKRQNKVNG